MLEFLLMDCPAHPGEYFPRTPGMRFRYSPSRPKFDVVTAIELGDLDRGNLPIDITGKEPRLYSLGPGDQGGLRMTPGKARRCRDTAFGICPAALTCVLCGSDLGRSVSKMMSPRPR
jgi:hypothetical protein